MTLGIIDSMTLDRVNFRLTLSISHHPRRGEPEIVVETFSSLEALLARYDALVREDDMMKLARERAPFQSRTEFPGGHGKGGL